MPSNYNTENGQMGDPASNSKFIESLDKSISFLRKLFVNSTFKAFNRFLIVTSKTLVLINYLKNISGFFIGIVFSIILYSSYSQNVLSNYSELDVVFFTIGGIIGTMTALVLSLSILPVQRASEVFSQTVIRFYTDDNKTFAIFFLLVLFCVLSFILGLNLSANVRIEKLFPIEIIILASTFDLIRWHFRHVSNLMTSQPALKRLYQFCEKFIKMIQRRISHSAKLQFFSLSSEERKDQSVEGLETVFYNSSTYHSDVIEKYLNQIAEIVHKAISREDTYTAKLGINYLVRIGQFYLQTRKDNLILIPSADALFLAHENDARGVLTPIYEHLQNMNIQSVDKKNEAVSTNIVKAYASMAGFTVNLKAKAFRENTAPITFAPIFYMKRCVNNAQENNMINVAYQASREYLLIGRSAPKNIDQTSVYIPLIDAWIELAVKFYTTGNEPLANNILDDMMGLHFDMVEKKHFQFNEIFNHTLSKLYSILPFALVTEITHKTQVIGYTFSPYDTTKRFSICYLVGKALEFIEIENDEMPRIRPFSDFMKLNEELYHHFYNIAENFQFGDSFILWHISETIKAIASVYLHIIEKMPSEDPDYNKKLVIQVTWYCSFFWITFSRAKSFNWERANHSCDVIAWIGISFYMKKYIFVIENAIENISSIINACCRSKYKADHYLVADLFIYLWKFNILAKKKDDNSLKSKVDEAINKVPEGLNQEQWDNVKSALETRKDQLDEELKVYRPYRIRDNSTSLLKDIIQ